MILTANRAALLAAAKKAAAIAAKSGEGALACALVESESCDGLRLTAANGESAIRLELQAEAGETGRALANAARLASAISLTGGERVRLSAGGRGATLAIEPADRGPMQRATLRRLPSEQFPPVELEAQDGSETVFVQGLAGLAKKVAFLAQGTGGDRAGAAGCIRARRGGGTLCVEASNSVALMMAKCRDANTKGFDALLPARGMAALMAAMDGDAFVMAVGESRIVFRQKGLIFTTGRPAAACLPDCAAIIQGNAPACCATLEAGELAAALRNLSAHGLAAPILPRVRIRLGEGEIRLAVEETEKYKGSGEVTVAADTTGQMRPQGFLYDIGMLARPLQGTQGKAKVQFSDRGLLSLRRTEECYMQAPLRDAAPERSAQGAENESAESNGGHEAKAA